jgi:Domain of unknown function (DUF6532)
VATVKLSLHVPEYDKGEQLSFGCDDELTISQAPGSNPLVMRSRPYRNRRIILAIRDLYFSGGGTSLASRYDQLFPSAPSNDGLTVHMVPVSMVALVGTAVSGFSMPRHMNLLIQITSYMHLYTSGALVHTRPQNSPRTLITMCIKVMFARCTLFRRSGATRSRV